MREIVFQNDLIELTLEESVGIIHICNGKQNRITNPEFIPIEELETLIHEHEMRGLIIVGSGRNFSVGADVEQFSQYREDIEAFREALNQGKKLLSYIENLSIPTVAVIAGACFGAGLEIALSCQFRFATPQALFAFPEAGLGLLPGLGGTVRLTRQIGRANATSLILTGNILNSQEAFDYRIVDRIVPKGEGVDHALGWIIELLGDKNKNQTDRIIQSINNAVTMNEQEAYDRETDVFIELMGDRYEVEE